MSGTGSGNTPTLVGWIAAILVGCLTYAVLQHKLGFVMPAAVAYGIAATLLVILLLSSSGGVAEPTETRVRKIVPQPERVMAEAPRPVTPTRVSAAPKVETQPIVSMDAPAPEASRAPDAAPIPAAAPAGLMAAPTVVEELAPKAAKAKVAKPKAEKPAAKAKPATAEGLVRLTAARGGVADDLKAIEGVGPALEKLVNGLGFYHFDQIANWSDADVALVDAEMKGFKGRIARDRWVAQAKIIVTEGLEAFRERAKTNNY